MDSESMRVWKSHVFVGLQLHVNLPLFVSLMAPSEAEVPGG